MERQEVETITQRLLENLSNVKYGSVNVALKIHDGRVVDVTHTVTKNVREYPGKRFDRALGDMKIITGTRK
jgi:hypothetical protein